MAFLGNDKSLVYELILALVSLWLLVDSIKKEKSQRKKFDWFFLFMLLKDIFYYYIISYYHLFFSLLPSNYNHLFFLFFFFLTLSCILKERVIYIYIHDHLVIIYLIDRNCKRRTNREIYVKVNGVSDVHTQWRREKE